MKSGEDNRLAQDQPSTQGESPGTQCHCIHVDPFHTGTQTRMKHEEHEGSELQIPTELLEMGVSITQKLLPIPSK